MEELQEKVSQGFLSESDEPFEEYGPNDVVAKVLGKRGGRVLCYGPHAKPKMFWRGETSNSKSNSKEREESADENSKRLEALLVKTLARIESLKAARGGVPVNSNTTVNEVSEETPSPASPVL